MGDFPSKQNTLMILYTSNSLFLNIRLDTINIYQILQTNIKHELSVKHLFFIFVILNH